MLEWLPWKKSVKESGVALVKRSSSYRSNYLDEIEREDQHKNDLVTFKNAYDRVPLITAIIDRTTEQVVQDFFFEGPNQDSLTEEADRLNIDLFLYNVCKMKILFGDCFVEAVPDETNKATIGQLKIINPITMTVFREKNGDVIGYGQIIEDSKEVLWGTTGSQDTDSTFKRRVNDTSSIIHFKHNVFADEKYGRSLIKPLIRDLNIKLDMEDNLKKVLFKYVAPLVWAKVGNDQFPAPADAVSEISSTLKDLSAESEVTTTHLVDLKVLDFNAKGMDIQTPIDHCEQQIITGGGVPPILLNRPVEDAKAADTQLKNWGRRVKAIQRELKAEFEDLIIVGKNLGGTEDKLCWVQSEEREFEVLTDILRGLVTDRVLTPQKANDLLPPRYRVKLPSSYEEAGAERGSQMLPGGGKVKDNPNDPTQTTKNPKSNGSRIKKSDRAEPEDDE